MKIIFMGTPQFAVPSLDALAGCGQDLVAVITRADTPKGRGLVLSPPPVKERAVKLGLKVMQPGRLSDPGFVEELRRMKPDLIAVVAYGSFLPGIICELPPLGTINLHPSLLPKYRGAAPIPHAILNGDKETGVSIIYLTDEMDAGDIVWQEKVPIEADDTALSLGEELAARGATALCNAVRAIQAGAAKRTPQSADEATFAPKISKEDGLVEWELPADVLERRIRAFFPWPGSYTYLTSGDKRVRLKITEAVRSPESGKAGVVMRCDAGGMHVGTGRGSLILKRVQPEGKRAMTSPEFAAGCRDLMGRKLG